MQQPGRVSNDLYTDLFTEEIYIMLFLEQFDDGAIFTNELDRPEFKGLWFSNKELLLQIIENNHCVLAYASYSITNDKKFMLAAISINIDAAWYLGDTLRNDKDIFIKTIGETQYYVLGDELMNDSNFLLYLVENSIISSNNELINKFNFRVYDDKELFKKLVKISPSTLTILASQRLRDDLELAKLAIDACSNERSVNVRTDVWEELGMTVKKDVDLLITAMCLSQKKFKFYLAISHPIVRTSRYLTCLAIEYCSTLYIDRGLICAKFRADPIVLIMLCNVIPKRIAAILTKTYFFVKAYSAPSLYICLRVHGW